MPQLWHACGISKAVVVPNLGKLGVAPTPSTDKPVANAVIDFRGGLYPHVLPICLAL